MGCPCSFCWEIGIIPALPPCHPLSTLTFSNCKISHLWKWKSSENFYAQFSRWKAAAVPIPLLMPAPFWRPLVDASPVSTAMATKFVSPIHQIVEQKYKPGDTQYHMLWTSWKKARIPFSTHFYIKISNLRRNACNMHAGLQWEQNVDDSRKISPYPGKTLCCAPFNIEDFFPINDFKWLYNALGGSDEESHLNEIN